MVEKTRLHIIAYAALGTGLSGGDNILIELSKRWADKFYIIVRGGKEIWGACVKNNLNVMYDICPSNTPFRYVERLFWTLKTAFTFKDKGIVYTASDFPHDLLTGWVIKLRYPKILWIAGYYLVVCPPFASGCPYRHFYPRIRALGYWLMQKVTLFIVNHWADVVYVTSEPEKRHFPDKKVVVVKGGVNIPPFISEEVNNKRYYAEFMAYSMFDVVFLGRLHYQKGIKELNEIWKLVKLRLPTKNLLIMGDGKLRKFIPQDAFWVKFADDNVKKNVFVHSWLMVHPATFDSGGMSCAEGMAYGLPAVGFDLETHKTYYEKGMIKVKTIEEFANEIIKLLTDWEYYEHWSREAFAYAESNWDWDKRAEQIYNETMFLLAQ